MRSSRWLVASPAEIIEPRLASRPIVDTFGPMRCTLIRDYEFEAAHHLPKVPEGHKCRRMHGHSYKVTVTVHGEVDPELGWLVDFGDIDGHVVPLIEAVDHRVLNDLPGLENPTSERLAEWLWQRIRKTLPILTEVAVAETPRSRCVYRGES